jgi:signal transduction histidine kinase
VSIDADGTAVRSKAAAYLDCWPPDEDLQGLCELAAQACEAPLAAIELIDAGRLYTVAAYGAEEQVRDAEGTLSAATIAAGEDVYAEDVAEDPRLVAVRCSDGRLGGGKMFAAAVLRDPAGGVVGTLSVADPRPERRMERRLNTVTQRRRMLAILARQVVDLFELSLRTAELDQTNVELARSQEHLAAFAAQISHDLKTPLSATLAWVELLGQLPAVAGDPDAPEYLQRCLASGRRMLTLIDQLLQYAGIGGTLARRRVPLEEVMSAVVQDLADLVSRGTVRWSGMHIDADPVQLRALLQNLVTNAFTYAREGVRPEVVVTALDTPGGVELCVADNGSGIPPERRAEVVLPLARHRTDVPGNGLGLAICQRIVTDHGGSLQIRDNPVGGTVVVATFPYSIGP